MLYFVNAKNQIVLGQVSIGANKMVYLSIYTKIVIGWNYVSYAVMHKIINTCMNDFLL